MQKSKLQDVFCVDCGEPKSSKFCNRCQKETSTKYEKMLTDTLKMNVSLEAGIKRGDISWAYFPIAYGILLTLSVGIIQLLESIIWYYRIVLIIAMALMFFYLCFFNGRFRNFIVWFFTKSKEFIEKI